MILVGGNIENDEEIDNNVQQINILKNKEKIISSFLSFVIISNYHIFLK